MPRISPSLLAKRLVELEDAGVLQRREIDGSPEYHPTPAGAALFPTLQAMGAWGHQWITSELLDHELDADLLMWDVRRRADPGVVPRHVRRVVRFDLDGVPRGRSRYWLVFERGAADLCLKPPGDEPHLFVAAALRPLVEVWMGRLAVSRAIEGGTLRLEGDPDLRRSFPLWFRLNDFAVAGAAGG